MKAALLWGLSCSLLAAAPLPPSEELSTFQLADPDLVVELVASEPQVDSPVAFAWDERGRLFVVEMSDYPRGSSEKGRLRLLEDEDKDGKYEKARIFASDLQFPTSVLPWKAGVFVTAAPDLLYLRDVDGDGRADEREVVFAGFAEGNQQLRVNGLFWGLDNWIYGANGRSDGEVKLPSGTVSLRGSDFRFDPRTRQFEAIAGRSQFGTTRDAWGNRFLSWNTIPIRHEVLPERYFKNVPPWTGRASLAEIMPADDSNRVYPLTPTPLTFNNESTSHFNALAGLTIYRGEALGEAYQGDAFMGETLRNLVHRRKLIATKATFEAVRVEQEKEFLASTDPWFHPVNFATGPDGALYVADFYRRFVEHPDFVPAALRDKQPWREGAGHGRIWRIYRRGQAMQNGPSLLAELNGRSLLKAIEDGNGWLRDTAQRLFMERQDQSSTNELSNIARSAAHPESRLQALWTLRGLNVPITDLLVERTGTENDRRVRRQLALLLEASLPDAKAFAALAQLAEDNDPGVRFQATLAANPSFSLGMAEDPWMRAALLCQLGRTPQQVTMLLALPALSAGAAPGSIELFEAAGEVWGGKSEPVSADAGHQLSDSPASLAVLAGMLVGLERQGEPDSNARKILGAASVDHLLARARELLKTPGAPLRQRVLAVRVVSRCGPQGMEPMILRLVGATNELARAAAEGVFKMSDANMMAALFRGWDRYEKDLRQVIQQQALRQKAGRAALITAAEEGSVSWSSLDRHVRDGLKADAALTARVDKLEQNKGGGSRAEVLARFERVLEAPGRAEAGKTIFAARCAICHRRGNEGKQVGPDLSGIAARPAAALLVDILDPSRQVAPDYTSYTVETTDDEVWTGLLVRAEPITLRLAGGEERVVPAGRVKKLQPNQRSLMPDGLEEGWSERDLGDLIAFLRSN